MAVIAPITGLSMASSTLTPSASSFTKGAIHVKPSFFRPTFFGQGVGTPKYVGIRLSHSSRHICNIYGGGSMGAQMNLFDRFTRVIKSYVNALISTFEDPEKILDQTVIDMNNDLVKMRNATAQVLASQKQLENKYKAAQQTSEDWYRRAQVALGKGDEDLAREALKRRKTYADNANAMKIQLDQQKSVVDNLVSNTRLLESKIQEAKSKTDTLKARAQSAKAQSKVNEMLGNVNPGSALSAVDKMEEKVLAMENYAYAVNQLTSDELEGKFALLETSSIDDDLDNMKKELSGRTKKGDLPLRSVNSALKFEDPEIAKELCELR